MDRTGDGHILSIFRLITIDTMLNKNRPFFKKTLRVNKTLHLSYTIIFQSETTQAAGEKKFPEWACMRATPLKHHNEKITVIGSVLEYILFDV